VIRAAGGVVVRDGRILLVHRPKYDDWSLPKGKCNGDETDEECAVREVEEETGLRCVLGRELPGASYPTSGGRLKVVRYWVMGPSSGETGARHEVDEVRWLPLEQAAALLSYDRDRNVLAAFAHDLEAP
jgi:8-oxo-dGTP diphosphatase